MLIKNLYTVQHFEQEENKVTAQIKVNKDNPIFKGHFPNNPVMPGVCMIQIIKELAERASGKKLFLQKASNVKFMTIINPEENPDLTLEINCTTLQEESLKVKNITKFNDTIALKFSGEFKII